jgi:methylamine dehydrogenase heavy chain
MSGKWGAGLLGLAMLAPFALRAETPPPLPAEQISVEKAIKPGPNVFVTTGSWTGAGAIYVFSADDLTYKGDYSTGMQPQFALSPEADTGVVASSFPKRIMYGPVEAVVQKFDVSTLKTLQEATILPKFAQVSPQQGQIQVSADGARAFVQNATPATSVSVVNLKTGKVTAEIPIPGCWQINLAPDGGRFSSLCGDGSVLTVRLGPDGTAAGQVHSKPLFSVEKDPLFAQSQRVDGDLVFVSYSGVFYRISDKGETAQLVDTFDFTKDIPGAWAPGGYAIMGYNARHGIMFVAMHSGSKNGGHKDASEEIWAVDLAHKTVLYRSVAKGLTQLAVSQGDVPLIFGTTRRGGLYRFEADPTAKFAAKLTHQIELADAAAVSVR